MIEDIYNIMLKIFVYINFLVCLFLGEEPWPPGCHLKFCMGENLSYSDRVMVEPLTPGQVTDVTMEMHSRLVPGVYQSQWRMSTATGLFYGGKFYKSKKANG